MPFADDGATATDVLAVELAFGVTSGASWRRGDVLGYSGGFVLADADAGVRPMFVALDDARASGELDHRVALAAVVKGGRYTGGTAGSSLYLSDTAGRVSESVGTVTYVVGMTLTVDTVMLNPMASSSQNGLFPGPLTLNVTPRLVGDVQIDGDLNVKGKSYLNDSLVVKGPAFMDRLSTGDDVDFPGTATFRAGAIQEAAIENGLLRYADVQLTNAQWKAIRATPITLVPAPGANLAVLVDSVHFVVDAAAGAYTETADNLAVEYSGGQDIMTIETTSTIFDGAAVGFKEFVPPVETTPTVQVANQAVQIFNNGDGEFGGGNAANTVSIRTRYHTVPTVAFT